MWPPPLPAVPVIKMQRSLVQDFLIKLLRIKVKTIILHWDIIGLSNLCLNIGLLLDQTKY